MKLELCFPKSITSIETCWRLQFNPCETLPKHARKRHAQTKNTSEFRQELRCHQESVARPYS